MSLWTFFNHINVITVPNSNRISQIQQNLRDIGILHYKIREFKPAKKIKNNGDNNLTIAQILKHEHCDQTCKNIAQNHLKLIHEAYQQNYENIMILEDDACFSGITPSKLLNIISWLRNNEWDIFYFGYCPWPTLFSIPITKDIVKIFSPLTTHCYVLNKTGIQKIVQIPYNGSHMDKFYAKSKLLKYACFPAISFQSIDPALHQKAMSKLGLNLSFKTLSQSFEVISIIIPIAIIFIIIFIIYKI